LAIFGELEAVGTVLRTSWARHDVWSDQNQEMLVVKIAYLDRKRLVSYSASAR